MKLAVPNYSQFVDINDPYWMLRACGMMGVYEVINFKKGITDFDAQKFLKDCEKAKEVGGYHLENGWIHDYLVNFAKEFGFNETYRKEGVSDFVEIKRELDHGNPVIVSVEKRVLEQTRFHLLVVVGYEINEEGVLVVYHDSECTDKSKGKNRVCNKDVFMEYFRGKMIVIK